MAKKISGSVGKGGKNKQPDVQVVQEMLNAFTKKCGFKKLDVDGLIGPKTNGAIAKFQTTAVGMSRADSRVDPGGKSLATLNMGPKKAEAEAKKAEKAEQKKKGGPSDPKKKGDKGAEGKASGAGNGKPQVKGDIRGLDKRILTVLEEVSAHYGKPIVVETGRQKPSAGIDHLWTQWTRQLKRGKNEPTIRRDENLRRQLDDLYNNIEKEKFVDLATKTFKKSKSGAGAEAHAGGRAVDIKRSTDSKVVAALATILRREDEGSVIHFDDMGKSIPKTIGEAIKKKWK